MTLSPEEFASTWGELTNMQFRSPLNLNRCWKVFSAEWKKVSHGFSETSVHDFRIAIRRLTSELEIASEVTPGREVETTIRKFRKTLRRFGALRDIQVHLLRVESDNTEPTRPFSGFLKRREKDEVQVLREWMREKKREALRRRVWNMDQKLQAALEGISRPDFRAAVDRAVRKRFDAVTAAYSCYCSSCTAQDFHRVRVKFKRFRYAAEIAKPFAGAFTKKQMDRMRELQKIMGEIHDLQTYMAAFVNWSGMPVPTQLQREYDARMKAFNDLPGMPDIFDAFLVRKHTKSRSVPVRIGKDPE
jgi:CHAD domain-containing protein